MRVYLCAMTDNKVRERDNSINHSVWPLFSDGQLTKIFKLNKNFFELKI